MTNFTFLQDLIANLDLYLPWLLPALESVEQALPSAARLPICIPLIVWLAFLRQRNAEHAATRLHRAVL